MKQSSILLDYLSEHSSGDTFSRIIIYIFSNKHAIPQMSITDLADSTFVTPSTISRFCKFFGFRTFQGLKDALRIESQTDPTRLFRLNKNELVEISTQPDLSFKAYGQAIIDSISDTMNAVDLNQVNRLIELIQTHEHIVVFGYSTSIRNARSLQEGLILSNKLTFVGSNQDLQEQLAKDLGENSLAIIISSYGNYFANNSLIFDEILKSKCTTVLLTQQKNIFVSASIDHIFAINSKNYQKIGSYSMNFFIDFLCRKYFDATFQLTSNKNF